MLIYLSEVKQCQSMNMNAAIVIFFLSGSRGMMKSRYPCVLNVREKPAVSSIPFLLSSKGVASILLIVARVVILGTLGRRNSVRNKKGEASSEGTTTASYRSLG